MAPDLAHLSSDVAGIDSFAQLQPSEASSSGFEEAELATLPLALAASTFAFASPESVVDPHLAEVVPSGGCAPPLRQLLRNYRTCTHLRRPPSPFSTSALNSVPEQV